MASNVELLSTGRNGSLTYYIYHSDNSNAQITGLKDQPELFKGKNPVEMPSESEVVLKINKTDWQTEVGLEGCMVDIFENGAWIGVVTTDEDGEALYGKNPRRSLKKIPIHTAFESTQHQMAMCGRSAPIPGQERAAIRWNFPLPMSGHWEQ